MSRYHATAAALFTSAASNMGLYDFEQLDRELHYWNGPYWLEDAVASDNADVAASLDVAAAG